MAIDVKEIIVSGLLELIQQKPLEKIKIKDILEATKVSRQTFYNHFKDKEDLLQYIYMTKIVPDYHEANENMNFRDSLLMSLENMKRNSQFMKQACLMEGQNCLKDFICAHCIEFDLQWHQKLYGTKPMPEALRFATEYHAAASSSMTLSWILSDMPVSCEEMASIITRLRSVGMDKLFAEGKSSNPYKIDEKF